MSNEQEESKKELVTFGQFARQWFYVEYCPSISTSTFGVSRSILERHIIPYFNDQHLHEITTSDIDEFYEKIESERYTDRTITSIFTLLSTLFRVANKKGYVDKNPMEGKMKMLKKPKSNFVPWNNDEFSMFLEVVRKDNDGLMYEFALGSGLRIGEILALRWGDIDFKQGTVIVRGRRYTSRIPLLSYLLPKLQDHKKKQASINDPLGKSDNNESQLVFPNKYGEIQNQSVVRAKLKRLLEKANVRNIGFHGLRQMHLLLLIEAGVPLYTLSLIVGYRRLEVLMELNKLFNKDDIK
ncbi:site-specific integrase [Fredinandcohnia sp. QZ13]|uniref:tyrosine-type recombinase/integrase n=1 Tax=Fredinandcohnia sp. QZ13 TaxID=3073144 RepID=UPI00285373F6|nr:site-specific integrase [Fredinandcohnia sp. QZ13]MDR4886254.1 site-specific integrase [Fredinandcohnia sp. QZ13]